MPSSSPIDPTNLTIRKPSPSRSRPNKRVKLEESPSPGPSPGGKVTQISKAEDFADTEEDEEIKEDYDHQCSICLQRLVDRTVIPTCAHEFCFECILVWTGTSQTRTDRYFYRILFTPFLNTRTIAQVPTLCATNPGLPHPPHPLQVRLPEALPCAPARLAGAVERASSSHTIGQWHER